MPDIQNLKNHPGSWKDPAQRRRYWTSRLNLSEAQVAWLPRQPRFQRFLGAAAPGWQQRSDGGGDALEHQLTCEPGEALMLFNYLAALIPSLQMPSRCALTLSSSGEMALRLSDNEGTGVALDEEWSAFLLHHAIGRSAPKSGFLRNTWRELKRRLRNRLGRRNRPLGDNALAAALDERTGWSQTEATTGEQGLLAGYLFEAPSDALSFANGVTGALGFLWPEVTSQVTLDDCAAVVVLSSARADWPPASLFDVADWIDELAGRLGGEGAELEEALKSEDGPENEVTE